MADFPIVEVDGLPVSQERVDPSVAAFIMAAAQTAQMVKLRKLEESKIPTGSPSFEWAVTNSIREIKLDIPWISFYLINDGPGNVRIRINNLEGGIVKETTIDTGETIARNFGYPVVNRIFLVTEVAGTAATVRIFAEEGRWQ